MREFRCTSCGICCMLVGKLNIVARDPEHKVIDRGDGICVNLRQDRFTQKFFCKIYATRPKICRVKESAPKWLPLRMTYWITERICWLAQKWLGPVTLSPPGKCRP